MQEFEIFWGLFVYEFSACVRREGRYWKSILLNIKFNNW